MPLKSMLRLFNLFEISAAFGKYGLRANRCSSSQSVVNRCLGSSCCVATASLQAFRCCQLQSNNEASSPVTFSVGGNLLKCCQQSADLQTLDRWQNAILRILIITAVGKGVADCCIDSAGGDSPRGFGQRLEAWASCSPHGGVSHRSLDCNCSRLSLWSLVLPGSVFLRYPVMEAILLDMSSAPAPCASWRSEDILRFRLLLRLWLVLRCYPLRWRDVIIR